MDATWTGRPLTATNESIGDQIWESLTTSEQVYFPLVSRFWHQPCKHLQDSKGKKIETQLIHALNDGDYDKRLEMSQL